MLNDIVLKIYQIPSCKMKCQNRVEASPEELVEAMEGKLSLEDRFLLDQSLEEC